MDGEAALTFWGVDPAALELAPARSNGWLRVARNRVLGPPRRCVHCGGPATVTLIADTTEHGTRWVDACTPDWLAASKAQRSGPGPTQEEILGILSDAAHEAEVKLLIITDTEEPPTPA